MIVPAHPMPAELTEGTAQRDVVGNGFSHDLAGSFLEDLYPKSHISTC
jgi:glutamate decarboxylase